MSLVVPQVKPNSVDGEGIPQIQNIVATVNTRCKLDLKNISYNSKNSEYNPKRFYAVVMRIREPRTTALIFSSGKIVCVGAKCEEHSKIAARKYARIIQKLGYPVKFTDFKIRNMVASCNVGFTIRLESLTLVHHSLCSYEPELFPGAVFRLKIPKIVVIIFVSGKLVLMGAKTKDDIFTAFNKIYPIVQSFKK